MLARFKHFQKLLRTSRQAVFTLNVRAVLDADTEHYNRHIQFRQDEGFRICRQALTQEIGAGEDADIEFLVDLLHAGAVVDTIIQVPEGNMLRRWQKGCHRTLTDQIIAGIADIFQLLNKLFLWL
ncbi:hypothetical protein D9M70_629250 [compost metagenome]